MMRDNAGATPRSDETKEVPMDARLESLVRIASTEFDGPSLMGAAFLPCLASIPFEDVARENTYEGYSVWGVALHVLYHKYAAIKLAGGAVSAAAYPYEEADWPRVPAERTKPAWEKLLAELAAMQAAWLKALGEFPMARWDESIPAWGCTVGQVLDCIALHDLYHVAQIRNMGLQSLRKK